MGHNATCRSCGARIRWIILPSGKRMAIDALPRADGNVTIWEVDGETHGRVLGNEALAALKPGTPRYVSHFSTCPHATLHRKG